MRSVAFRHGSRASCKPRIRDNLDMKPLKAGSRILQALLGIMNDAKAKLLGFLLHRVLPQPLGTARARLHACIPLRAAAVRDSSNQPGILLVLQIREQTMHHNFNGMLWKFCVSEEQAAPALRAQFGHRMQLMYSEYKTLCSVVDISINKLTVNAPSGRKEWQQGRVHLLSIVA